MELSFDNLIIFWLHSNLPSADLKMNFDITSKCALEARAFQLAGRPVAAYNFVCAFNSCGRK